jgi:hypothetical protein
MMVPDFVNLRGVWGWVGTLKDYWSTRIASMGGTLIFGLWWPRTAFQRCITSSHPPYAWTLLEASSAP